MTRHSQALEADPDVDLDEPVGPPARPARIELAAAILIVGGAIGVLGAVASAGSLTPGMEPFLLLTIALDVGSIVAGLLVRFGRLWILAVNYVAVLGFLDLLAAGGSPLALMLGLADILVVVILLLHKPWFDAMGRWRASRPPARNRLSP